MYQLLGERFYQTAKYRGWDQNTKLVANRLFTIFKNFYIELVLFV